MDRREKLIEVFQDTQRFYREDPVLASSLETSRKSTVLYEADDYPALPEARKRDTQVQVSDSKTFETAMRLNKAYPDKKIAVLNFASASRPGGGVKNGSSAQEESLCRCSTLFPTLDQSWLWKKYYDVNRAAHDVRHSDACIYSPGVMICKTDESFPRRMDPKDFVTVDVISCAAPNLRNEPANWHNPETGKPIHMDPDELYAIHVRRGKHILHVAAANQVDILILGAFGCGAFQNDPSIVAKAYLAALAKYKTYFDLVEFAIYCRKTETENYTAFQAVLG